MGQCSSDPLRTVQQFGHMLNTQLRARQINVPRVTPVIHKASEGSIGGAGALWYCSLWVNAGTQTNSARVKGGVHWRSIGINHHSTGIFFFTVSLLLSSYRMQLFGQCEQKGVGLKTHSMNLFFPHRIFANSLETAAKLVFPLFVQLSAFTLSICILWSSL